MTCHLYFLRPFFELHGLGTMLLKNLYENIYPLYPVNKSDKRVLGGNSLSDVRVGGLSRLRPLSTRGPCEVA